MQLPFTLPGRAAVTTASLRVLHCIPTLAVGGAETQLRLLAPRLVARGLEVAIFGRFAPEEVRDLVDAGVTCLPLKPGGNYDPAIVTGLLRAVRALRPDVIQTWLPQMDISGGLVVRFCGIPWVIAERSSPLAYAAGVKNGLRQWLGRGATVIANAPHGLDVWPGHPRADVIGNGIDFAAVSAVPRWLMKDVEPFRDRTSVVTVSRLVPEKGVDVLIEAIAMARRSLDDIRLVIVGDGPDRARLTTLVAERGMDDHVSFVGIRSDPVSWLRSADLYASASRFEGHPNAVTEAAAAGVPCVLSDIVMHRSLLGDAARYAAQDDPAAFAEQIVTLARDPALREAIVADGRRVVEPFGIDTVAARYHALYERLRAGRAPDRLAGDAVSEA